MRYLISREQFKKIYNNNYRIDSTSTSVADNRNSVPSKFLLYQNYPNPFNPTTKIRFQIADFGFVSLKVYDVLGNEVAELVNEEKTPGSYEVEFSSGLIYQTISTGVYFYQLRAGNFVETKKMLLMK